MESASRAASGRARRRARIVFRESLKRKYASSILSLKDEFLKKRKKGKLPAVATDALKEWWRERLVWPYPTEADKATLGRRTGLNPTQINNWFINQRKRHWHKLFPGAQPATAEEASGRSSSVSGPYRPR